MAVAFARPQNKLFTKLHVMALGVKVLREGIQIVVVGYHGFETVYLLRDYRVFAFWCEMLPYISKVAPLVAGLVIAVDMLIVVLALFGSYRSAMQCSLWACMLYTLYLCVALLTSNWFFTPFHPYWTGMTWLSRMLIALGIAWSCWWWIKFDQSKIRNNLLSH